MISKLSFQVQEFQRSQQEALGRRDDAEKQLLEYLADEEKTAHFAAAHLESRFEIRCGELEAATRNLRVALIDKSKEAEDAAALLGEMKGQNIIKPSLLVTPL